MRTNSPRFALFFCVCSAWWAAGAAAQTSWNIHYYNKLSRVDVSLASDELVVLRGASPRLEFGRLAALAPGGILDELRTGDALIQFASPAVNLIDLKMRGGSIAALGNRVAAVGYLTQDRKDSELREIYTNRFSVKLVPGDSIEALAAAHGLRVIKSVPYSERTYVVETESNELLAGIETANALFESGEVEFATPEILRQRQPRLIPNDTLFSEQWHLRNTGQTTGGIPGEDVNILSPWNNYTGQGVNIAISDDGVQVAHEDLAANARTDIDIDLNDNDDDPTPSSANHGTSCAGIAAARGNNGKGVAGAAFRAGIVGIRLIEFFSTDQTESEAMNHQVDETTPSDYVHINSNSWGPSDCGCILGDYGPLTEAALMNGVTNGRGGLGTIYVWAGGNGRSQLDNVNFDAYASSRFTIAVGATGADGTVSGYSESGVSLLVNAPSSYTGAGTTTTTFPFGSPGVTNQYTSGFGGTSSAAPLVAGVIALMLEANPNLSWRDVQHILAETAEKNDPTSGWWIANSTGRTFNQDYGFGRVDAKAAVERAVTWVPLPANALPITRSKISNSAIPDNNGNGISSTITITGAAEDFFIEHVEVSPSITHPRRGDLFILIESPSGRKSILAPVHNDTGQNYNNWTFTTLANWGEHPNGNWRLVVKDLQAQQAGALNHWTITIHGFRMDFSNTYVSADYSGIEQGTVNLPFNSLNEGVNRVSPGGTLHVKSATYTVSTITKAMQIHAEDGVVRLVAP